MRCMRFFCRGLLAVLFVIPFNNILAEERFSENFGENSGEHSGEHYGDDPGLFYPDGEFNWEYGLGYEDPYFWDYYMLGKGPCDDNDTDITEDKLVCILYAEIGTFKSDDGPKTKERSAFAQTRKKTAKVAACRAANNTHSGIRCKCPNVEKIEADCKGKRKLCAAKRTLDRLKASAKAIKQEMKGKSKAQLEAYCEKSYHFYHHEEKKPFTGYFTKEMYKAKTTDKYKLDKWGSSAKWEACFPELNPPKRW